MGKGRGGGVSERISADAYKGMTGKQGRKREPGKRSGKYNAVPVTVDGIRFASKLEARYYEALKLRQAAGQVAYFLCQVPFHLPGGVKYVVDFVEFHTDGVVRYVDTKGHVTETFKIKKRMVEELFPVKIEVVRRMGR
jgi:hypothetical protein